jgi:hypothetical protein
MPGRQAQLKRPVRACPRLSRCRKSPSEHWHRLSGVPGYHALCVGDGAYAVGADLAEFRYVTRLQNTHSVPRHSAQLPSVSFICGILFCYHIIFFHMPLNRVLARDTWNQIYKK